jgi:hypothetical protein
MVTTATAGWLATPAALATAKVMARGLVSGALEVCMYVTAASAAASAAVGSVPAALARSQHTHGQRRERQACAGRPGGLAQAQNAPRELRCGNVQREHASGGVVR